MDLFTFLDTAVKAPATVGSSMMTNGSLRTANNYRSQPQYSSMVSSIKFPIVNS